MDNIISEYQKWKQQGATLRTQAKQAMENRFRDLLTEAAQVAQEYQSDFGGTLKPPLQITAFRYKSGARLKPKKGGKSKAVEAPPAPPPLIKPDPKVTGLEKKLATARKKLDAAKAAGTSTKNLEDRIYELEDDLRLATAAV